jgi:hypothetical protein
MGGCLIHDVTGVHYAGGKNEKAHYGVTTEDDFCFKT